MEKKSYLPIQSHLFRESAWGGEPRFSSVGLRKLSQNCSWLTYQCITGRSSLNIIISHVKPKYIFIPSYYCYECLESLVFSGSFRFYDSPVKLTESLHALSDSQQTVLVILLLFNGSDRSLEPYKSLMFPTHCFTAIDACMCPTIPLYLLEQSDTISFDFLFTSGRKHHLFPLGSLLTFRNSTKIKADFSLLTFPSTFWFFLLKYLARFLLSLKSEKFIQKGIKINIYSESIVPTSEFLPLSAVTLQSLHSSLHDSALRVLIYNTYFDALKLVKHFFFDNSKLLIGDNPLYFILLLPSSRSSVVSKLVSNEIFPTILWQPTSAMKAISQKPSDLCDQILCLPINPSMTTNDVYSISALVLQSLL